MPVAQMRDLGADRETELRRDIVNSGSPSRWRTPISTNGGRSLVGAQADALVAA